jgi:hypothetical protein
VAESVGFVRKATVISEDVLEGVRGTDHQYVLRGTARDRQPGWRRSGLGTMRDRRT